MTLFSEKVLIANRCISGLMSNLIRKSCQKVNTDMPNLANVKAELPSQVFEFMILSKQSKVKIKRHLLIVLQYSKNTMEIDNSTLLMK